VLAPFVAKVVPAVFATLFALPVVGFVTGVAWHSLPPDLRHGLPSGLRLVLAVLVVAALCATSLWLNAPVESALFAGDFKAWLRGDAGSGTPLLRVGLGFLGVAVGALLGPWLALRLRGRRGVAWAESVAGAVVLGVAFVLASPGLEHLVFGGDFRAFLVGKEGMVYDQRNSLVVGIAMGFAVIPIIYTIAEDALVAIPQSLRSASLACGASPWQTAMRIVVPAAVPGIFSATMIGLGRAIGETMIVLMATGGTPIIDLSIFNGFRTLSVNIATELPEAPQGGTLYRVLFLAGLLLFALTFVLNTVAEVVRLRFRNKFRGL
jgi:phosphate transport system permease protein